MKIFLCIQKRNDDILAISAALEEAGHEVSAFHFAPYDLKYSFPVRTLYKFRDRMKAGGYKKTTYELLKNELKRYNPDVFFFVNLPNQELTVDELSELRLVAGDMGCKLVVWLVDPLDTSEYYMRYLRCFDAVSSYEKVDAAWLSEHAINSFFCPVGYQNAYKYTWGGQERKEMDVSFIGTPYRERLDILERLAERADIEGWKIRIYGPFYRHWWKKYQVMKRCPHLQKYIVNGILKPEEIAEIYKTSTICLNLHVANARGLNPRSYEIMATGGFEITDQREDYNGFEDGKELVTFTDVEDLLNKCNFYINHPEKCRNIARAAYEKVQLYSMSKCIKYIFERI